MKGLSSDGRTMVGSARNPDGKLEGWIARLEGPPGAWSRSDWNRDGFIDGLDYDGFMNAFEAGSRMADYDADCFVDGIDYDQFMNDFETGR